MVQSHDIANRGCSHYELYEYLTGYGLVTSYYFANPAQPIHHMVSPQGWLNNDRYHDSAHVDGETIGLVAYRGSCRQHREEFEQIQLSVKQLIVVSSTQGLPHGQSYIEVSCARSAWALSMKRITGLDVDAMSIWGVTGTNGKSSTIWLLHELLKQRGLAHLVISTFGVKLYSSERHNNDEDFAATPHTTPDADILYLWLKRAYKSHIRLVIMEVTSHSLVQKKLLGLHFAGVAFTSFSRDHLDYHQTMADYFAAKWQLFEPPYSSAATRRWIGASVVQQAEFQTHPRAASQGYALVDEGGDHCDFMAHNLGLAKQMAAAILQQPLPVIDQLSRRIHLTPPVGRMELVHKRPPVIIDYAHTPAALALVLQSLRRTYPLVWVVFGCGGDRDKGKRVLMGQAAATYSDRIFLTSDNPRHEDPQQIIAEIKRGFTVQDVAKLVVHQCRATAIETALAAAVQYFSDYQLYPVVLIAGKGHEQTQIIGDTATPYSDHTVVQDYFASHHLS